MKKIVIVAGGYAGFYAALGLEKRLNKSDEAEVILIDPRPYMAYQPGRVNGRNCHADLPSVWAQRGGDWPQACRGIR